MTAKLWRKNLLIVSAFVLIFTSVQCTTPPVVEEKPVDAQPALEEKPTDAQPVAEAIETKEPVPMKLRLSYFIKGEYAPLFIAKEKGWYKDAGVDMEILEGGGSAKPNQLLVSGEEQFAYIGADEVIRSVEIGMPLIMVGEFLQITPQAIASLETTKNDGPEDLIGKTVADTAGGTWSLVAEAFFRHQGIDPEEVNTIIVDWGAKHTLLLEGEVDMVSDYVTNYIPVMRIQEGLNLNYWLLADYGFNMLAHGICVSKDFKEKNPDIVKGIVQATQKGFKYTVEHPEEAAQLMADLFPDALTYEIALAQITEANKLYHTERTKDMAYGYSTVEDWEQTVSILYDNGGMESRSDAEVYFTNEFVDMTIK